ncbi:hypothetical protein CTI12_AA569690 [Artemisia annua]|uniref:Replication factor A C-terminal domain-containing protein n=1 Tax=Artemisia annua TaxID=35608 RepID=A0A2U1KSG2_ARTAN|nr:hypothetical protein CTI12_AA569690 [Artemisia annua]
MKVKRKAVPNRTAEDMPIQVSQSSDSETLIMGCQPRIQLVTGVYSVVVSAGIDSSVASSSSFNGSTPGSSLRNTSAMEIRHRPGGCPIANGSQNLHLNQGHLLVSCLQPQVDFPVGVPVQVPAVDGSVSTFQGSNIMHPSYVAVRQPGIVEVIDRPSVYGDESAGHVPMVLDFSTGSVTHSPNLGASSCSIAVNGPQTGVPARDRRQAGRRHLLAGRRHILNGQPCMTNSADPPVQGPVAPPQRQGAPLDYKCFGRCDQVCQYCGALFWLEEKRTGLPISVAPQYQRCCTGGHDNNALVKLFRTARDKLREADIPNFSIRLFGVVGANQYELPTADGIGAIVYEGGPESQIQLSATSATRYYFNPAVQETGELLAANNEANAIGPRLEVQTERLTSWEQERNRNRVPLATLLQIDLKTQQRVLFIQEAMILQIDTKHHWYYQKCDECGGKLTYGYLHGQCHQYGTKPNPENSYCFRIVITDGTGNALMSCFTPQTDGLIKDVNTLLEEVENKDPATIPPAILALQNTRHVFQFQFATPTMKGPPTFVLKKIMDNPLVILSASSAGPSSPPRVPITTNTDEEYTPPPATPTVTQDTPIDAPTITPQPPQPSATNTDEEYTPPPATPTVTQDTPIDAPTITPQPPDPSARKELFPASSNEERDPIPKKQKKE